MALKGANTSAQWYQDNYPGGVFSRLDKFVLHTTETEGWPAYSGGASSPNATYHPRLRQIRQHHSNNRSSRALRDPSGTAVRENRDNVFQLEIICYSDKRLGDSVGGLWVGDLTDTHMRDIAAMMIQLNDELGLPLQSSVTWREGRTSYYGGVRLSGSQFDAYRGILGHVHVSGNTHWDPGGFRYSKLNPFLEGDDHMSAADVAELKKYIDARTDAIPGRTVSTLLDRQNPYGRADADGNRPTNEQILGRADKRTFDLVNTDAEKLAELIASKLGGSADYATVKAATVDGMTELLGTLDDA